MRCPNGWNQKCFYQKNADDGVDESISRVKITLSDGSEALYMMADSVTAIVALLQMGVLEIHPWGSRSKSLGFPDRIVLDLDPDDELPWSDVKEAVVVVKTLIENIGLTPFLKTTGGKGLHVVYDSVGQTTFDKGLDCLRPRGYMVLFGQSSGPVSPFDPGKLAAKGSLFLTRPTLAHYTLDRAELLQRANDLFTWTASGKLKLRIEKTFPMAEAAEAHRQLGGRKTTGKVILLP